MKKISILIPCYNEEENVVPLSEEIIREFENELPNYDYEIVFIDNASRDNTQGLLRGLCKKNKKIKAIFNYANFEKTSSLHGRLQTTGDCVIALPADFQVPVSIMPELIRHWENGAKLVAGIKENSKENKLMWAVRSMFYKFVNIFSNVSFLEHYTGFGSLMDRELIEIIRKLKNPTVFSRAFTSELNPVKVYFNQPKRRAGRSKSGIRHLVDTAFDVLTQSTKIGSRIALFFGTIISIISAIIALVYLFVKLFNWGNFSAGLAPVIIGVFFLGSVQIFFIGLIGEYITAINEKLETRPYAIEAERLNFDNAEMPDRIDFGRAAHELHKPPLDTNEKNHNS